MRVLVTAASRHGSTREIAKAVATGLERRGLDADAIPAEEVGGLDGYDAVVVGSAVYYGHWLESARHLVDENESELAARPVWLFSSGPLGYPGHRLPADDAVDVVNLLERTGALEHRIFPGKLDRAGLSFRERAIVAALRAPEGDFRDWAEIEDFAGAIAAHLRQLVEVA